MKNRKWYDLLVFIVLGCISATAFFVVGDSKSEPNKPLPSKQRIATLERKVRINTVRIIKLQGNMRQVQADIKELRRQQNATQVQLNTLQVRICTKLPLVCE